MTTQTTYAERHTEAFVGQIATTLAYVLASGNVEAAAGVPFGKPVVVGTGDGNVKVPALAGHDKYVGIAVRSQEVRYLPGGVVDVYPQYSSCAYIIKGEVWVTVGENVADGDPVFFNQVDGAFYKATADDYSQIPNAMFMTTATSGNLAKVRLN